jgi:hypothetical protein
MTTKSPTEPQTKINAPCRQSTPNTEANHRHNPLCVNESGYSFKECIKCERKMLNLDKNKEKLCINCEYEDNK